MSRQETNEGLRFLVTTPGVSATRWLSFALASHPDVFVAHGKSLLDSIVAGTLEHEQQHGDRDSLALGNVMSDFYRCRPLHEVFIVYRHLRPTARAWGNVHSYALHELLTRFDRDTDLAGVRIVNVLRHPVNYIASHTALVRSARDYPALAAHYRRMFDEALERCPELLLVECEDIDEFAAFAVSCQSAARFEEELSCDWVPHVPSERLTSDADALKSFCEDLTGLPYDRAQLEALIARGPINSHRSPAGPRTPQHVFAGWSPWQRDVASVLLGSRLLDCFEQYGYDVSMLRGAASAPGAALGRPETGKQCVADFVGLPREEPLPVPDAGDLPPALEVEGYRGFNVIRFQGQSYGLSQALGPVDLESATEEWISARRKARECFVSSSATEVCRQIDHTLDDAMRESVAQLVAALTPRIPEGAAPAGNVGGWVRLAGWTRRHLRSAVGRPLAALRRRAG